MNTLRKFAKICSTFFDLTTLREAVDRFSFYGRSFFVTAVRAITLSLALTLLPSTVFASTVSSSALSEYFSPLASDKFEEWMLSVDYKRIGLSLEEGWEIFHRKFPDEYQYIIAPSKIRDAYVAGKFPLILDELSPEVQEYLSGEASAMSKGRRLGDYLSSPTVFRRYNLALMSLPASSQISMGLERERFLKAVTSSIDRELFKARLADICQAYGAAVSISNSIAGDGFERFGTTTEDASCEQRFLGITQIVLYISNIDASKCSSGLCVVSFRVGCYGATGLGGQACLENATGTEYAKLNIVGTKATFVEFGK